MPSLLRKVVSRNVHQDRPSTANPLSRSSTQRSARPRSRLAKLFGRSPSVASSTVPTPPPSEETFSRPTSQRERIPGGPLTSNPSQPPASSHGQRPVPNFSRPVLTTRPSRLRTSRYLDLNKDLPALPPVSLSPEFRTSRVEISLFSPPPQPRRRSCPAIVPGYALPLPRPAKVAVEEVTPEPKPRDVGNEALRVMLANVRKAREKEMTARSLKGGRPEAQRSETVPVTEPGDWAGHRYLGD